MFDVSLRCNLTFNGRNELFKVKSKYLRLFSHTIEAKTSCGKSNIVICLAKLIPTVFILNDQLVDVV